MNVKWFDCAMWFYAYIMLLAVAEVKEASIFNDNELFLDSIIDTFVGSKVNNFPVFF